jgi:anti-anti-sigma factor
MSLHDVQITDGPLGPVIALSGEVDMSAVEGIEGAISATVPSEGAVLVLDLRDVDFLDSSGLRVVLRIDREQREAGKRLVVVRGGRRVARVLELTGAERQLEMVDDPAEIQA